MFETFLTFFWMVWLITLLSLDLWIALSSVWSRCFWASQILWSILTSTECTICCSSMHLMNSQLNIMHVWNVLTFYWMVRLIKMLLMNLCSSLSSVWSRCFWASKKMWWILTSDESTCSCSSMPLKNSQLNPIDAWNVFNVLLNS